MTNKRSLVLYVQGIAISVIKTNKEDYINITDMSKKFGDDSLVYSRMRNRNTLEFI